LHHVAVVTVHFAAIQAFKDDDGPPSDHLVVSKNPFLLYRTLMKLEDFEKYVRQRISALSPKEWILPIPSKDRVEKVEQRINERVGRICKVYSWKQAEPGEFSVTEILPQPKHAAGVSTYYLHIPTTEVKLQLASSPHIHVSLTSILPLSDRESTVGCRQRFSGKYQCPISRTI
jgi:hypothetical protein